MDSLLLRKFEIEATLFRARLNRVLVLTGSRAAFTIIRSLSLPGVSPWDRARARCGLCGTIQIQALNSDSQDVIRTDRHWTYGMNLRRESSQVLVSFFRDDARTSAMSIHGASNTIREGEISNDFFNTTGSDKDDLRPGRRWRWAMGVSDAFSFGCIGSLGHKPTTPHPDSIRPRSHSDRRGAIEVTAP